MTSINETDSVEAGELPAGGGEAAVHEGAGEGGPEVVMGGGGADAAGVAGDDEALTLSLRNVVRKNIEACRKRILVLAQQESKKQKIAFTPERQAKTESVVAQACKFAETLQNQRSVGRVVAMTSKVMNGDSLNKVWKHQDSAHRSTVTKTIVVASDTVLTTHVKTKGKTADPLVKCNFCILVSGDTIAAGLNFLKKNTTTTISVPSNLDRVDIIRSIEGKTYALCDIDDASDMEKMSEMVLVGGVKLRCQMPTLPGKKMITHECQPTFSLVVPQLKEEDACEHTYEQLVQSEEEFGVFRVFVQVYMEHGSKTVSHQRTLLNITDMYRKKKCGGYEYAVVSSLENGKDVNLPVLGDNVSSMLNNTSVINYILKNTFTPKNAEVILAAQNQPCEIAVYDLERNMKSAVANKPTSSVEQELYLTFRYELVCKCQKCPVMTDGVADEVITAMHATDAIKFTHVDNKSMVMCTMDKVSSVFSVTRKGEEMPQCFSTYSKFTDMLKKGRESQLHDGHLQTVSEQDGEYDWIFNSNSKLDLHYSFFSANLKSEARTLTVRELQLRTQEVQRKGGHIAGSVLEFAVAATAAQEALTWEVYISPVDIVELPLSMQFDPQITPENYAISFNDGNVGTNSFFSMILSLEENITDVNHKLVLPTLVFKTLVAFSVQKHVRDEEEDDVSIFTWAQQLWRKLTYVRMTNICLNSEMYTGIWTLMHVMLSIIRSIDFAYAIDKKIQVNSWGNIPGLNRSDDIFTMVENHRDQCPNHEFKNAKLKPPHKLEFGPRHVYMILARWSDIFVNASSGADVEPMSSYFQAKGEENFRKTQVLIEKIEAFLTPEYLSEQYLIADFQRIYPDADLDGENVYTVGDDEELKNGPPCVNLGLPGTWMEQNDVPCFTFTSQVDD
jgi:hypothetical protein